MKTLLVVAFIVIIIIALRGKKKPSTNYSSTRQTQRRPSQDSIELANKYFGNDWRIFLHAKTGSHEQPYSFTEAVSFALESLSGTEHKKLLLTFLSVTSNFNQDSGARGLNISVGVNNYKNLHEATLTLIKSGKFSESGMLRLFREQIAQNDAKERAGSISGIDDSLFDVTGQSERLHNSGDSGYNQNSSYSNSSYSYDSYDPTEYRLGKLYKDKLGLTPQEASWLNKFWNPNNVFLGIEGCCIATIKLYLSTLKQLNQQLKKAGSSLTKEVEFLQKGITKYYQSSDYSPYWGGYDTSYFKERTETDIFLTVFKRAENAVREAFGNKRKIATDFSYNDQSLVKEYETRIGIPSTQIIQSLISTIQPPDEATEISLNAQNVNRWKSRFEELQRDFNESNKQAFIDGVHLLERNNQKNPTIENIFFEASKFIAKLDKPAALKFYIYYLYYDLKSDRIDNKQLTKTIQKNLFSTNEQLHKFSMIVANLVETKNLKGALEEAAAFYQPKRKKIQLDDTVIKAVQKQDQGTVELLNEYLQDEFEDNSITISTEEINKEEIKLEIVNKGAEPGSLNPSSISNLLNETQIEAITMITSSSFKVSTADIDAYCRSKGVFRNQLIDSINESCFELLDDVLIEEFEDGYSINEDYYKKISAQ